MSTVRGTNSRRPKIIVIAGPTASGKSELAVNLAKKFGGEVVSADSRQVYRGLDIGSGKITKKERQGIPHHLLDVASPKRTFTVKQYVKLAEKAVADILRRGKIPIIVGGTGFYIRALVDGITIPEVLPNQRLRARLEKKSVGELFRMLKEKDPERASTIEKKNPRRLIRALEIVATLGRVPKLKTHQKYDAIFIGVKKDLKELRQLIEKRFRGWLRQGFLKEVQRLHNKGIPEKRIWEFGLHYNEALLYFKKEISKEEFVENSIRELLNYAKRQMTWFKRDRRIHWIIRPIEAERYINTKLRASGQ